MSEEGAMQTMPHNTKSTERNKVLLDMAKDELVRGAARLRGLTLKEL